MTNIANSYIWQERKENLEEKFTKNINMTPVEKQFITIELKKKKTQNITKFIRFCTSRSCVKKTEHQREKPIPENVQNKVLSNNLAMLPEKCIQYIFDDYEKYMKKYPKHKET